MKLEKTTLMRLSLMSALGFCLIAAGMTVHGAAERAGGGPLESWIVAVERNSDKPPTPAPRLHTVTYAEDSIDNLQLQLSFEISQPQGLDPATNLTLVRKVDSAVGGPGVELTYSTANGQQFVLTEHESTQPIKVSVDGERVVREVDINGRPGFIYDPGPVPENSVSSTPVSDPIETRAILQWTNGSRWYEIRGSIGFDEMVEVARSLPD